MKIGIKFVLLIADDEKLRIFGQNKAPASFLTEFTLFLPTAMVAIRRSSRGKRKSEKRKCAATAEYDRMDRGKNKNISTQSFLYHFEYSFLR